MEREQHVRQELKVDHTVYASIRSFSQLEALTTEVGLLFKSEICHTDTDTREVRVELQEPGRFEDRRYIIKDTTAKEGLKTQMSCTPRQVRNIYGKRESRSSQFLRRIFNIDSIVKESYPL